MTHTTLLRSARARIVQRNLDNQRRKVRLVQLLLLSPSMTVRREPRFHIQATGMGNSNQVETTTTTQGSITVRPGLQWTSHASFVPRPPRPLLAIMGALCLQMTIQRPRQQDAVYLKFDESPSPQDPRMNNSTVSPLVGTGHRL